MFVSHLKFYLKFLVTAVISSSLKRGRSPNRVVSGSIMQQCSVHHRPISPSPPKKEYNFAKDDFETITPPTSDSKDTYHVSGPSALVTQSPNSSSLHVKPFSSTSLPNLADVLSPRDIVGEGFLLQNERLRLVSSAPLPVNEEEPAQMLEVIRHLGAGSYAAVYEVREVLESKDSSPKCARHYAIKCLSKANLDEDALATQISEVTSSIYSSIHDLTVTRPLSTYHLDHILMSSLCTAPWRLRLSCCFC
jgi:hypothetical protein